MKYRCNKCLLPGIFAEKAAVEKKLNSKVHHFIKLIVKKRNILEENHMPIKFCYCGSCSWQP